MAIQKGFQIEGAHDAHLVYDRPMPSLREGYILVKTAAVALNPTDWKHIDKLATKGALSGCDYSGTVEEVGSGVTKPFKKGDRVFGFVHGGNNSQLEDGAFAEYIVAKAAVQMRLPPNISFEEAATLGVGIATVGQGLYLSLKLPLPSEPAKQPFPVLIYGGSTATGSLAIQFAKLSGLEVITTCSQRNANFVKSLGADRVYDYHDADCGEKIRVDSKNKIRYAFDCHSEEPSLQICADALSSEPGSQYSGLVPFEKFPREDVEARRTLAYDCVGEDYNTKPGGPLREVGTESYEFTIKFVAIVDQLVAEGKFKVHPPTVKPGGLAGISAGLDDLREGRVSGEKLVYRIADTPAG